MLANEDARVFTKAIIEKRVTLPVRYVNKHTAATIKAKLMCATEGKCTECGYVRRGSVDLVSTGPGVVETANMSGDVTYAARFSCDVCNPSLGDRLTGRVENVNTFGLLVVNLSDTRIFEIIVPRASMTFEHEKDFADVQAGERVVIEIMGKRMSLNQPTITMVGRFVGRESEVGGEYVSAAPAGEDGADGAEDGAQPPFDDMDGATNDPVDGDEGDSGDEGEEGDEGDDVEDGDDDEGDEGDEGEDSGVDEAAFAQDDEDADDV